MLLGFTRRLAGAMRPPLAAAAMRNAELCVGNGSAAGLTCASLPNPIVSVPDCVPEERYAVN